MQKYLSDKQRKLSEQRANIEYLIEQARQSVQKDRPVDAMALAQALGIFNLTLAEAETYQCDGCDQEFDPAEIDFAILDVPFGVHVSKGIKARIDFSRKIVFCETCYKEEVEGKHGNGVDSE